MSAEACCTCATLLADAKVPYDPDSEKPIVYNRRLSCCSREICALCQYKNPRFQNYCPFCQISSGPSVLPKEGLRLPPSYSKKTTTSASVEKDSPPPPSYDEAILSRDSSSRRPEDLHGSDTSTLPPSDTRDTIHHVDLDNDTLASLSLAYNVPVAVLRRHNNLFSDSLLAARKHVLIPRSHYDGPPLSTPPDPEEEGRKTRLRRWMVATKCADYGVATLYLKGSGGDLDTAVQAFRADEEWERDHPLQQPNKGKTKSQPSARRPLTSRVTRVGGASTLSGQLS
ncbi:uncharacterized protein PV06_07638 [Exophiala oligosperma]|uniref:LysM domain-containing protein n=2 Tax=Chaetothyriales TaxID=34395 RepID=A0A0D2BSL0_9EURO|nr:uncharacterized protein PV06_07638 [Exophiala oligosperma]KAJ9624325.1 hypothetical protein H2204_010881 [Knufia peltigerae]KIW40437.1 hypothetical protein PV06_07638 [Exophiala oligosperma]